MFTFLLINVEYLLAYTVCLFMEGCSLTVTLLVFNLHLSLDADSVIYSDIVRIISLCIIIIIIIIIIIMSVSGTFIMEYVGEVLDYRAFKCRTRRYARENYEHHYFMALSADEVIDAAKKGNVSRFINHCCDPNAETQKVCSLLLGRLLTLPRCRRRRPTTTTMWSFLLLFAISFLLEIESCVVRVGCLLLYFCHPPPCNMFHNFMVMYFPPFYFLACYYL